MSKYLSFNGTATRQQYWAVVFISFFAHVLLVVLSIAVGAGVESVAKGLGGFITILSLLIITVLYLIIHFSNAVRRCRDADINPWWSLAQIIPYAGFIVLIVIGCLPSIDKFNNPYGVKAQ
jgi:uncharacterized membrane protein YhaH (DUF805 family)